MNTATQILTNHQIKAFIWHLDAVTPLWSACLHAQHQISNKDIAPEVPPLILMEFQRPQTL